MYAGLTKEPISINRKVFQELFEMYFNALCAFSRRFVDADSAEDIVQEVFISFWKKRADFSQLMPIKSFLYTSVRNKCLNHIRDEVVRQKHLNTSIDMEASYDNEVIEEETFNLLYNEIMHLPTASQQIMLLAMNGLKNPDIAEELGISVNTVKTQKKIAYAKLKTNMSGVLHSVLLTL